MVSEGKPKEWGEDPWVGGLSGVLAAKILLKLHEAVNTHVSSFLGYPRTMAAYYLNWDNQTFLKYGISHLAY